MTTLKDNDTVVAFRRALTTAARAELGTVEQRVNRTKYGAWYGLDGLAWCAQFVSWVYATAAKSVGCENPLINLQSPKGFAGCTDAFERMKKRNWVLADNEAVRGGDIVIWDHDNKVGGAGHTGIVVATKVGGFGSIEGNTNDAYSRTGGKVCRHDHLFDDGKHGVLLGICRPTRRFNPL
jgi:hypothetical protein